jgi:hypothetical protein
MLDREFRSLKIRVSVVRSIERRLSTGFADLGANRPVVDPHFCGPHLTATVVV